MYSLEKFKKSQCRFLVYEHNKIVFHSKASGIKPLVNFIKKFNRKFTNLVVYDKIVGRAAALLIAYIKVTKVYTPLISNDGASVFKKHKIIFVAQKRVKYIVDYNSPKLCRWENLAKNQTPTKFWGLVKNL